VGFKLAQDISRIVPICVLELKPGELDEDEAAKPMARTIAGKGPVCGIEDSDTDG